METHPEQNCTFLVSSGIIHRCIGGQLYLIQEQTMKGTFLLRIDSHSRHIAQLRQYAKAASIIGVQFIEYSKKHL